MNMDIPAFLLRHTVSIQPYAGTSGFGAPTYADATDVACFVEDRTRLVTTPTGDEVTSNATVIAPLDTVAPVESLVTLPSGRVARVITALRHDGGGLPVPDHLEIQVT